MTDRIYYDFKYNEYDDHIRERYGKMEEELQEWEEIPDRMMRKSLVSYGISSRVCKEAVKGK